MPYDNISQLPKRFSRYSEVIRRQYVYVFNSVYKKILKETKDKKQAETRSIKGASSVLKKRFKKGQNVGKESHSDYFSMLIDNYLGNIPG